MKVNNIRSEAEIMRELDDDKRKRDRAFVEKIDIAEARSFVDMLWG